MQQKVKPGESDTLERTVFVDTDSPTTNIGEACGTHRLGGEVCDTNDAEIAVVLAEELFPPTLPRTGFGLRLRLLWSGVLLAAGAAALTLEETVQCGRAPGSIGLSDRRTSAAQPFGRDVRADVPSGPDICFLGANVAIDAS